MWRDECSDRYEIEPQELKKDCDVKAGCIIATKGPPKKAYDEWTFKKSYTD
ncbi:hypothetical protein SYK_06380 [Pseudodesulfovibrio nedwellii]|uniref:Uncharacterized protein n=1 Tax=Pseudodesulfovibrio nedwellii TaxID=2973072 RepID=A0ABM8AY99_9BACT|nr:hypothetical protein SYK_06380 [Pseudodesulfovibrio nedwellii]